MHPGAVRHLQRAAAPTLFIAKPVRSSVSESCSSPAEMAGILIARFRYDPRINGQAIEIAVGLRNVKKKLRRRKVRGSLHGLIVTQVQGLPAQSDTFGARDESGGDAPHPLAFIA
jgi:hypothetical protein